MTLLVVFTALLCGSTSLSEAGGDCSLGFLDLNSISEGSIIRPFPNSSLPKSSHLFDFSQWMFPNVRFTCTGFITSWRLMVRIDSGFQAEDPLQIPQITTWKLISLNSGLETDNYMQYTITNITEATVKAGDGYIEYTPSPPTQVHAGDFVGIEMPTGREFKEARMRVRPLFLKLPHENSNATSCLPRVANINFDVVVLSNGLCLNQPDQQYPYIPLLYATFAGPVSSILPSVLPFPTTTFRTRSSKINMSPTPSATPQDTITRYPMTNLTYPPQSEANSSQLVVVIVVVVTFVVMIIVLTILLVVCLIKTKGRKLGDQPWPQNMKNAITSHTMETKNCETYSLPPTTHQITTQDNPVYGQATPRIATEENVAYGQLISGIVTVDNVAYVQRNNDYDTISDYVII